mgnify:FL=1
MGVDVLEPRDHGTGVLRERRRIQCAQRPYCPLPHTHMAVLEPRGNGVGVLGERRRIQLAQLTRCLPAHVKIGVLELRPQHWGVCHFNGVFLPL